jgi:cytochrome P450
MLDDPTDADARHRLADAATTLFLSGNEVGDAFWPSFAVLRESAPVYHFGRGGFWIVTGHEECRAVLGSAAARIGYVRRNEAMTPDWREHRSKISLSEWFGHWDEPEHLDTRKVIQEFFMPKAVESYRERIAAAIRDVVAQYKADGGGEFRDRVTYRITTKVTSILLGLPEAMYGTLIPLIGDLMQAFEFSLSEDAWRRADLAAIQLRDYWRGEVERRVSCPDGDDIVSRLVRQGRLSREHIATIGENLLAAAFDTTAHTGANCMYALLANPGELALARLDAAARASVVDETLRMYSAAPAVARVMEEAAVVGGKPIPAGATVIVCIGAANRDPRVFEDPARFDLRRPKGKAIAFAQGGSHVCIGQWLARMVLGLLCEETLSQWQHVEIVGQPRFQGLSLRVLDRLELRVH